MRRQSPEHPNVYMFARQQDYLDTLRTRFGINATGSGGMEGAATVMTRMPSGHARRAIEGNRRFTQANRVRQRTGNRRG